MNTIESTQLGQINFLLQQLVMCVSNCTQNRALFETPSLAMVPLQDEPDPGISALMNAPLSTLHVLLNTEINGIRCVLLRQSPLDAQSTAHEVNAFNVNPMGPSRHAGLPRDDRAASEDLRRLLSPREQEIARMIAKGYPNKTIATVLEISPWTVGTHLRRIFAKLNVPSRAAMVARVMDAGLLK